MQRGFMLIEVLIASLISAMLGTILFAAYYQSNRVTRSIDDFIDVYSKEALLQHQLGRDLFGAFIPEQARAQKDAIENVFVSSNKDGMLDMVTFITNNPLTMYGGSKPRIVRVLYRLKEEKVNDYGSQEKTSYVLLRQESINLDLKAFKKSDVVGGKSIRIYEVADGIKEFKVEYSAVVFKEDKIEVEKKDVWNSEPPKEKDVEVKSPEKGGQAHGDKKQIMLPQIVTLSITLWDSKKERERSFVISAPIFVGGIDEQEFKKRMKAQKEKQAQKQDKQTAPSAQKKKVSKTSSASIQVKPVSQQKQMESVRVEQTVERGPQGVLSQYMNEATKQVHTRGLPSYDTATTYRPSGGSR